LKDVSQKSIKKNNFIIKIRFFFEVHEQAKKREEVLNRAKQIQQDKEQKNQLRVSDNQSKTATITNQKKGQGNNFNNSTTFNNSMNESTNLPKTIGQQQQQQQIKPVILDTTSNKILGQNKIFKQPANIGLKKPTTTTTTANAEYTFVVDKNNPQRNDITLPSSSLAQPSAQHKADWTILPTPTNAHDELELDTTMTLVENISFYIINLIVKFLVIQLVIQLMVIMVLKMYVQIKIPIMKMKMKLVYLVGLKVCV
jgi:hypothetical protein